MIIADVILDSDFGGHLIDVMVTYGIESRANALRLIQLGKVCINGIVVKNPDILTPSKTYTLGVQGVEYQFPYPETD